MKTLIAIIAIILSGCTIPRANSTVNQPYSPSQSGLIGGLIGAGIGIGMGAMRNTSIDQKIQNYGNYSSTGRWNNKPRSGSGGRKGGYSQSGGYNNVSRVTTKNRKGENMYNSAIQFFQAGQQIGYSIGTENQTRRLKEENEKLRQAIIQLSQ